MGVEYEHTCYKHPYSIRLKAMMKVFKLLTQTMNEEKDQPCSDANLFLYKLTPNEDLSNTNLAFFF